MCDANDNTGESGAASRTALRVAALRALHQSVDAPPVFADPLAERMLGPDAAALLEPYRAKAAETASLRATLAARGVVAAAAIAEAVERGVGQCVILGAGLDTFAYRNMYAGLRVFEVDHPKAQAWKRAVLRRAAIEPPQNLTFVGADFEADDAFAALAAAGCEAARPAIFVMLGVSFYLQRATLLAKLARIAALAPGTEIVFDYIEPLERAPEPVRTRYRAAAARAAEGGEPWISFFMPADLRDELRRRGFATVIDLDRAALNARWFEGRSDTLAVGPLVHLVRARTGGPA